ncbi:major facilitator superfamily domain-containing protein [Cokeromyces recurvatus]|uniref:major facilitator superfamily domain-containing protein n=1 Tax=Cokeromyces recurvatus TaxID=90255 RepID=UPI00221EB16C|nr:major facilitator superfamily domain-containing protein [Cokeromyces recurvatus]KAI7898066.1 major facilitator superfamily domain-containing protein [Cokeromyces recurvatus]
MKQEEESIELIIPTQSPIELEHLFDEDKVTTVAINRVEEIEFVFRMDKRLLLFAMFGNLVKSLDNANLGSAFISGMEEELKVTGLQYNWMGVLFMIGYLTMQIPSNILLSNMRPSKYLPALEAIWCILTIAMACVQSVKEVYLIRFLLGLAEAGFYPGIVFLLGTWYTKKELGKRLAMLTIFGSFGSGLSGIIQAIMLKTMDGVFNISGWRWMFLFDAFITGILASVGYHYLPDYPHNTDWLDPSEKNIALERLNHKPQQDRERTATTRLERFKLLLGNPYLYLFAISWASIHISLGASHVLGIVAKKLGFDSVTSNLLTTPDMLITMLAGLCNGFISDTYRTRLWCIIIPAFIGFIGMSLLSLFVQPFFILYIAFLLTHAGLGSLTSIIMTWASESISSNSEIRAMAIAIMNTFSSLMWIWTPLVLWPVTDAPYYYKGFTTSCFLILFFIGTMSFVGYLQKKSSNNQKVVAEQAVPLLQETTT